MAKQGFKRKLTAILSADVKGYSRLMGNDEEATVRILKSYRMAMADLVQQFRGRIIDTPGDNILAEFPSVVDAVNCAVEIQRDLAERNAKLSDNRKMEFRIGINLGDVIEEEGRIYGDGVNIAARVESLAEAGGICISGTAYDQVENKLGLGYENLGRHRVKNITRPIRIFRVISKTDLSESLEAGKHDSLPLPDKPSIAVLPFDNMSHDEEQEHLADGITENIIAALARIPEVFVIARNSVFTYRGKAVKVQQVGRELGVRYVLEGSIQKADNRVRVTAQLLDAKTGHHLWAERYDREIMDFFALLDEIAKNIAVALQVELTHGEQAYLWHTTENFEAWSYGAKAMNLFERYTKEENAQARELFKRAINFDPKYAWAKVMLAWTHFIDARFGWCETPADSLQTAFEIGEQVLELDDTLADVHALRGAIFMLRGKYNEAIAEGEISITLSPAYAEIFTVFAQTLYFAGRPAEAIPLLKKAMRLHPLYPDWYLITLGGCYRDIGLYDDAISTYRQILDRAQEGNYPDPIWAHEGLVSVYMRIGQEKEARFHAHKLLRINPNYSLKAWSKTVFFKDKSKLKQIYSDMRRAGLPE